MLCGCTKLHYIYSFSWRFYPKWLTIAIYVRGRTRLEQLGVKCLAQGHIGSHTVRFLIMPCFHCMSVLGKLKPMLLLMNMKSDSACHTNLKIQWWGPNTNMLLKKEKMEGEKDRKKANISYSAVLGVKIGLNCLAGFSMRSVM